jgi:hypothetical protein
MLGDSLTFQKKKNWAVLVLLQSYDNPMAFVLLKKFGLVRTSQGIKILVLLILN